MKKIVWNNLKNIAWVGLGISIVVSIVILMLPKNEGIECGNNLCEMGETSSCPNDCQCRYFTAVDNKTGDDFTDYVCATVVWSEQYDNARRNAGIPDPYLEETQRYDYSHPVIQSALNKMKDEGITDTYDAIVWVANYVKEHTIYDFTQAICSYSGSHGTCVPQDTVCKRDESCKQYTCMLDTGTICELDTASTVLERGCGWCSTQSYAVIGLLRGIGIASKQEKGCVYWDISCLGADGEPMINKGAPIILPDGRVIVGGGGAHSWVMAWVDKLPDGSQGWVIIESTSGRVKPGACLQYQSYDESLIGNNMCYIEGDEVDRCDEFCQGCIY